MTVEYCMCVIEITIVFKCFRLLHSIVSTNPPSSYFPMIHTVWTTLESCVYIYHVCIK